MKLEDFFTRPQAETGKDLIVKDLNGLDTPLVLKVLGTESGNFINARREWHREEFRNKLSETKLTPNESQLKYAKMVAHLIAGWSATDEFSYEAACELCYQAPYIGVQVETFASLNGNQFEEAVNEVKKSCSDGQNETLT